ncbi:hypothetical protein CI109_103402 [Kwoniella shandongensis]|uniref:Uncharacterized protein n=1 Tax=Kwoniella shandongensis TaxID=1734106 RepID=A0A5M6BXW4_9TREE|nr:uncharacterized protein CI109_004483 [Kwoniella shandongensis]KAA5527191.1 hypothetical protein CI109_004483 [Kwoniella shandongensis]
MSSAKKLQSKLFGPGAPQTGSTPSLDQPGSGNLDPSPTGSGTATPIAPQGGEQLKINIPAPPGQAGEKREKENLPKRPSLQQHDTPPAPELSSPHPTTTTSDTDTPGTAGQERKTLRDRLIKSMGPRYHSVEEYRLDQSDRYDVHWKRWGPYVSERQWGTVREDYSANGDAWNSFPFEMAKSRAYRWGEDGMAGISDNHQRLCFTLALWNGKDPILKERLYGLNGNQGNHGEDVKELYYYLDSTPTHSYMKYLYKYPQAEFPYEQLKEESRNRSREVAEFELMDTDVFDEDRYWDVFVEYAKDEEFADAMSIRITAYNRGPDPADLHILPQMFFRNTWSWPKELPKNMPQMKQEAEGVIYAQHETMGSTRLYCTPSPAPAAPAKGGVVLVDGPSVVPDLLFTENETNFERLYGGKNRTPYVKDAFHDHVIPSHRPAEPDAEKSASEGLKMKSPSVRTPKLPPYHDAADLGSIDDTNSTADKQEANGDIDGSGLSPTTPSVEPPPRPVSDRGARLFVNPEKTGTKSAAHYSFKDVPGKGGCVVVRLKMTPYSPDEDPSILDEELFDDNIEERRTDADEFYGRIARGSISDDLRNIMRQALSGMLWTKQYYQYIQKEWMDGDPGQPPPPPERKWVRNREWKHMYINDILSMPDKWEYPWFATWDTAFHCIPLAMVDPSFAKKQLDLMTREWYMKPDGALPAYEWNFSDVNPPVHAWSTFRVFKIERKMFGREDLDFLERVFQKLLLNFTWWVNRKDADGNNVFEGGFLGLDNIGPFNRSEPLPTGGTLRQADGTAWMAFFCLNMLSIALELAKHNPTYEDIASKFFEHFLFISDAMTYVGSNDEHLSLWNEEDGFYYDAIQWGYGHSQQLPVRSMVGLMPLYATLVLEPSVIKRFPGFKKRMDWFIENRPDISDRNVASLKTPGKGDRTLLALASKERLVRILEKMLDEKEFLSEYGVRSMSLYHHEHPFSMNVNGEEFGVGYWPGDSRSGMFGGNSNWRGPIWLAVNFLLIESLQRFHQYYGETLTVECPTGSGDYMSLAGCAEEIQHRLIHIFSRDEAGRRAVNGGNPKLNRDPNFRDYVQFFEFFHGNDGRGLGASHQTGWTGLVAWSIMQTGEYCRLPKTPRTPRSVAKHYFDEQINTPSEYNAEDGSLYSAYSTHSDFDNPEPDDL